MNLEYCHQGAMECRERTSRENAVRCGSASNRLDRRSVSNRPLKRSDTVTPSCEAIKFITPDFNREAAA
jgi:hypothetical protein